MEPIEGQQGNDSNSRLSSFHANLTRTISYSEREAGMRFADSRGGRVGGGLKMISAVLWPFLFLAGHEGDCLPASRTEGGRMQMPKHFSVCPDYLSSPSSFIRVHKFILRAHIPPCLLTLCSLGGHCNPVQVKPPFPIQAGSEGRQLHGAISRREDGNQKRGSESHTYTKPFFLAHLCLMLCV